MASYYINGIPLKGVQAPLGPTVTPHLNAAVQGLSVPIHPSLSVAIDAFVQVNPPPKGPKPPHANSLWVSPRRHVNRWPRLDRVALDLHDGKPQALKSFRKILGEGTIAEMRMALEQAKGLINMEQRNRALLRLRSLEREFADWRRSLGPLSFEEKRDFVRSSVGFNLNPHHGHGGPVLDLFFDLAQLHTFIRTKSGLLEPFAQGMKPSNLVDFLTGELGILPQSGACHPLSLLAAHLGKKIGLPLKSYFSERHITLFVDLGPGFIYDPTQPLICFLAPDTFVREKCSPKDERPYGLDLLVLETELHKNAVDDYFSRQADWYLFLIEHVAPQLWHLWFKFGYIVAKLGEWERAQLAVERGLRLFPESLPLLVLYTDALLQNKDVKSARETFLKASGVVKQRLELGEQDVPFTRLLSHGSSLFTKLFG